MGDPLEWDGHERRSAPLHIIRYVDGRMREHTQHVESILRDHIADEMLRFGEIKQALAEGRKASEDRHAALLGQLTAHLARVEQIERAFVEGEHGPDFAGHHHDHSMRQRAGEWWDGVKRSSTTKVIEYTLIAVLAWLGVIVWQAFLKGPVK